MSTLLENWKRVVETIPSHVSLVAISKTKPVEMIQELFDAGQTVFGENKVQELVSKYEALPKTIEWHMVGHLQSNKVKYIAPFVSLIHSIDSLKLLKEVNKQAKKNNRTIPVLLQMHIAEEDSKFGLDETELNEICNEVNTYSSVEIIGLMGMATFTDDEAAIRKEFGYLEKLFQKMKALHFHDDPKFKHISMGMSGDYPMAIEEGSTMVRVGSHIFGSRN